MSAATVWKALKVKYKAIQGIKDIVLGEPTTVHATPLIYAAYDSFDRPLQSEPPARNLTGTTHQFAMRLLLDLTDPQTAEEQLLEFVDRIPDAIAADAHLDQTIASGHASVRSGVTGYITIAKTLFRMMEFTCTVLEKRVPS